MKCLIPQKTSLLYSIKVQPHYTITLVLNLSQISHTIQCKDGHFAVHDILRVKCYQQIISASISTLLLSLKGFLKSVLYIVLLHMLNRLKESHSLSANLGKAGWVNRSNHHLKHASSDSAIHMLTLQAVQCRSTVACWCTASVSVCHHRLMAWVPICSTKRETSPMREMETSWPRYHSTPCMTAYPNLSVLPVNGFLQVKHFPGEGV